MRKSILKLVVISSIGLCSVRLIMSPCVVSAKECESVQTPIGKQLDTELIKVIDPYIVENVYSYSIVNKNELIKKIGLENVKKLEKRLELANLDKAESLNRDAVHEVHIEILRRAGASVESLWWGKRIKTHNRTTAINVRRLANAFTGDAGDAGVVSALAATGISFIPGLGTPAAIAGAVVSVVSWADSTTWNKVATQVSDKIDEGEYNLTIDINAWDMEVKVY